MKKLLLVITAVLGFTGTVKAATTWSDKNWSSEPKVFSWTTETLLDAGNEAIAIGDVITVTFSKTNISNDASVALNSVYTQIVSQYYNASDSPSSVSFIISARERDAFRRFGLNLTGNNITVTAVAKTSPGTYTGSDNSIWVGSSNGYSNVALNAVKDVKAGDRIIINMSHIENQGTDFVLGYVNSGWTSIPFATSDYSKTDTKVELKVTSTIASNIRSGQGIYVNGSSNYTYTSIDLITEDQTATQTYTPASALTFEGNSNFDIPTDYFKGLSAGDKMIVTVTDMSGTAIYGGTGEDKETVYHRLGLAEQNWTWVGWISDNISATGDIEIDITAQMLTASKTLPLKIHGSNCVVSQIKFKPANVSITITGSKYATYSCEQPLDFTSSSVEAYYASNVANGTVTLTKITEVPANTGIVVYCATANTYSIPVATSSPAAIEGTNYLKTNTLPTSIAASEGSTWNYIFAKNNSDEVGFYKLTSAHILGAHKAYLQTTTDITPTSNARIALFFDNSETTGINEVTNKNSEARHVYYDLSGRRVAQPTKGLYIVNGKKVVIK